MNSDHASPVPLSELVAKGVAFRTSEAVALTAEVCRQVFNRDFSHRPDLDQILINPDGSIDLRTSGPGPDGQLMVQLASLLEAVLPPLGTPEPEFAVRASLRMLPPRARQLPGLPPILGPENLAAELERFATGVLRMCCAICGFAGIERYTDTCRSRTPGTTPGEARLTMRPWLPPPTIFAMLRLHPSMRRTSLHV